MTYTKKCRKSGEGETASLRRPTYTAADLGYGPLHPDAMLSPRVAPQMIGLLTSDLFVDLTGFLVCFQVWLLRGAL